MTVDQLLDQVQALGGAVVLDGDRLALCGIRKDSAEVLLEPLRRHREEILRRLKAVMPTDLQSPPTGETPEASPRPWGVYSPRYPLCVCGKEMAPALLQLCLGFEDGTGCRPGEG